MALEQQIMSPGERGGARRVRWIFGGENTYNQQKSTRSKPTGLERLWRWEFLRRKTGNRSQRGGHIGLVHDLEPESGNGGTD